MSCTVRSSINVFRRVSSKVRARALAQKRVTGVCLGDGRHISSSRTAGHNAPPRRSLCRRQVAKVTKYVPGGDIRRVGFASAPQRLETAVRLDYSGTSKTRALPD